MLDFACGICDRHGELVAQTNGITIFTGTFSHQVRFIVKRFGGDMAPGATFLTNDPFEGDYHACDTIDGDGTSDDAIAVEVTVRIRGATIEADFIDSSPARNAPINCSRGARGAALRGRQTLYTGEREVVAPVFARERLGAVAVIEDMAPGDRLP